MSTELIGSFESKTRGPVQVLRGYSDAVVDAIFKHSMDPGITKTLGGKDLNRFSPAKFPSWIQKGGGRDMYTGWNKGNLAGLFWIGGEKFPGEHFHESPLQPPYTAAWRTGYSTPEGGTYEGEGIGKRIALAGIADVVELTRDGGPQNLPPLSHSGLWIDTGLENTAGQNLYHHLGNTSRLEEPIGFRDIGIFTPPYKEGATAQELEPRVGMVADPATIQRFVMAASVLIERA